MFLNILIRRFKKFPLSSPLGNIYLMIRWKCLISIWAKIEYPFNVRIGRKTTIGKVTFRSDGNFALVKSKYYLEIGHSSIIKDQVYIDSQDGRISIGNYCSINPNCILYGSGSIKILDNTRIASSCNIIASGHDYNDSSKLIRETHVSKGILIKNNVWIGANCTIIDGSIINGNSVIGASSLVNKIVEENSIGFGIPYKNYKFRE